MAQHEIGCFGTRKELAIKPETLVVAALTKTWGTLKIKQVQNKIDVYPEKNGAQKIRENINKG